MDKLWLIREDGGVPNPNVFWGPFDEVFDTKWVAPQYDPDCVQKAELGSEVEFPSARHFRAPGFLCSGCRPANPFPRGFEWSFANSQPLVGTQPAGWTAGPHPLVKTPLTFVDLDSGVFERILPDNSRYRATVTTIAKPFTTTAALVPTEQSDFNTDLQFRYTGSDRSIWILHALPPNIPGDWDPIPEPQLRLALSTSRTSSGSPSGDPRRVYIFARGVEQLCPNEPRVTPDPFVIQDQWLPKPPWQGPVNPGAIENELEQIRIFGSAFVNFGLGGFYQPPVTIFNSHTFLTAAFPAVWIFNWQGGPGHFIEARALIEQPGQLFNFATFDDATGTQQVVVLTDPITVIDVVYYFVPEPEVPPDAWIRFDGGPWTTIKQIGRANSVCKTTNFSCNTLFTTGYDRFIVDERPRIVDKSEFPYRPPVIP